MTPCIEIEYENISRWVPGAAAIFKDREKLQKLSYGNLIGCADKPFKKGFGPDKTRNKKKISIMKTHDVHTDTRMNLWSLFQ